MARIWKIQTPTQDGYAAYMKVVDDNKHIVVKPGDKIPFKGMDVEVLTAAGKQITSRFRAPASRIRFAPRNLRPPRTSLKMRDRWAF